MLVKVAEGGENSSIENETVSSNYTPNSDKTIFRRKLHNEVLFLEKES